MGCTVEVPESLRCATPREETPKLGYQPGEREARRLAMEELG